MYIENTYIYPCISPMLNLFQNSMTFPRVTDSKFDDVFHDYFHSNKVQELFMKFNDFSTILKQISISMIFQELWNPVNFTLKIK